MAWELVDPKFEWDSSADPAVGVASRGSGRENFRRFMERYRATWRGYEVSAEELIDAGDNVVAIIRETVRAERSDAPIERDIAQVWTLRDGRAVRYRVFQTRQQALEAAGLRFRTLSGSGKPETGRWPVRRAPRIAPRRSWVRVPLAPSREALHLPGFAISSAARALNTLWALVPIDTPVCHASVIVSARGAASSPALDRPPGRSIATQRPEAAVSAATTAIAPPKSIASARRPAASPPTT